MAFYFWLWESRLLSIRTGKTTKNSRTTRTDSRPLQSSKNHQGNNKANHSSKRRRNNKKQRQQQPPRQQQQSKPQEQPKQQQPTRQQPTSTVKSTRQPQQAYGGAYHGGVRATAPTNGGVHPSGVPQHSGQVRSGFSQSKAGNWSTDHKTWQQRGGYNGYRIPDARFSLYFGREHHFRI